MITKAFFIEESGNFIFFSTFTTAVNKMQLLLKTQAEKFKIISLRMTKR